MVSSRPFSVLEKVSRQLPFPFEGSKNMIFQTLKVSRFMAGIGIDQRCIFCIISHEVILNRGAKAAAAAKGISTIHLSLSHSGVSFTSCLIEDLF